MRLTMFNRPGVRDLGNLSQHGRGRTVLFLGELDGPLDLLGWESSAAKCVLEVDLGDTFGSTGARSASTSTTQSETG